MARILAVFAIGVLLVAPAPVNARKSSASSIAPSYTGTATVTLPTICPTSTVAGKATYSSSLAAASSAPAEHFGLYGTPNDYSLQIKSGTNGFLYNVSNPTLIQVTVSNGSSLQYDTSSGRFSFYGPNCSYVAHGKMEAVSNGSSSSSSIMFGRSLGQAIGPPIDVRLTLKDECGHTDPGQSPHLLCYTPANYYGTEDAAAAAPKADFVDQGNGLYVGTCATGSGKELACSVAETYCTGSPTYVDMGTDVFIDAFCDGLGAIVAGAADVGTEGAAVPASIAIARAASRLCAPALNALFKVFCKAEFPYLPGGSPPPCYTDAVYAVLSMPNINGANGPTSLLLGTATPKPSMTITVKARATSANYQSPATCSSTSSLPPSPSNVLVNGGFGDYYLNGYNYITPWVQCVGSDGDCNDYAEPYQDPFNASNLLYQFSVNYMEPLDLIYQAAANPSYNVSAPYNSQALWNLSYVWMPNGASDPGVCSIAAVVAGDATTMTVMTTPLVSTDGTAALPYTTVSTQFAYPLTEPSITLSLVEKCVQSSQGAAFLIDSVTLITAQPTRTTSKARAAPVPRATFVA